MGSRTVLFKDRHEAAALLAARLREVPWSDVVVLALARGGVAIGAGVAKALNAPLDVLVVRKIGAPHNPEYGVGAVTEAGYLEIDDQAAEAAGLSASQIEEIVVRETQSIARQIVTYRGKRPRIPVAGKTVIVVDDGLATGVTAGVACRYIKDQGARRVVLAVPVCASESAEALRSEVDRVICLEESTRFFSVGEFYRDFRQLDDEQVVGLLRSTRVPFDAGKSVAENVIIRAGSSRVRGRLIAPPYPSGWVIVTGVSADRRDRQVVESLVSEGWGVVAFREFGFDAELVENAVQWLRHNGVHGPIHYLDRETSSTVKTRVA